MRRIQKRILGMALVVTLGLGLLSGCNTNRNTKQSEAEENGEVTISWWTFPVLSQENASDPAGTYEQKLVAAFEEAHPGIHVKIELIDFTTGPSKITMAMRNGSECDVLLDAPGRIISYGKEGDLISLDDLFTDDMEKDLINEQVAQACKSGDTAYMYPLSTAPFYMAFNKADLEEAGVLDLVKEGWTTDDLTTVLTALRDDGYVPGSLFCSGTGGDQGTRAFIANLYSSHITNDDLSEYTINDAAGIKGMEYAKNAIDEGLLLDGTLYNGSDAIEQFVNGRNSFCLLWGPSQQKSNQATLDRNQIETVEVPYPSEDGKPELEYLVNGFGIFDHQDEARADAAKEFVKFVCDDKNWGTETVIRSGCFPVRTSFGELYDDAQMQKRASWAKYYGTYYNTIGGFGTMRNYWYQSLQFLVSEDRTEEEIIGSFVEKANKTIEQ